MEKNLNEIQHRYEETKRSKNEQKFQLNKIKTEIASKIKKIIDVIMEPTNEYLHTIDELQNQISKIEAHCCFENGKLKLVSYKYKVIIIPFSTRF